MAFVTTTYVIIVLADGLPVYVDTHTCRASSYTRLEQQFRALHGRKRRKTAYRVVGELWQTDAASSQGTLICRIDGAKPGLPGVKTSVCPGIEDALVSFVD